MTPSQQRIRTKEKPQCSTKRSRIHVDLARSVLVFLKPFAEDARDLRWLGVERRAHASLNEILARERIDTHMNVHI